MHPGFGPEAGAYPTRLGGKASERGTAKIKEFLRVGQDALFEELQYVSVTLYREGLKAFTKTKRQNHSTHFKESNHEVSSNRRALGRHAGH